MVSDDGRCSQKFFTGNHPFVCFFIYTSKKWGILRDPEILNRYLRIPLFPHFFRKVIFKMVIKKIKTEKMISRKEF